MKFWTEATPLAKLRLIAFLVVGLTAVHAAFLLYSLYRHQAGASVVNLAGRQRLLVQRLAQDASRVASGDVKRLDDLHATADQFTRGLRVLEGGHANRFAAAPPPARAALRELGQTWKPVRAAVDEAMRASTTTPERASVAFIVDRSEELLARADALTSVLDDEARVASRRPLLWMLGAVPFGLLLAALALAQVRRIGERTERVARMARRMVEGDVEPFPVDLADRDELVEVQRALNEMAMRTAIQSRRQAAQHAATRVLAESETLGRAMPAILKAICESLGWHWSALWTIDRQEGVLRCGDIWHAPSVQLADFSAMSQHITFAAGVGLPGRVWASGESAWIADVQQDPNFPRLPAARKVGLHGAFCFPIPAAGGLIGVMEFFSTEAAEPDTDLLAMMDAIGTQIGEFVERCLAHEQSAQKALALSEAHQRLEHDFAERTEASRRLMAQHAATRALGESASLDDAAPRILKSICEALGWAWSALWVVDPDPNVRALRWVTSHGTSGNCSAFEDVSRTTSFAPGEGLPGRVWSMGRPAWITDVTLDPNFPRAPIALTVGLRGALAFPIWCEGRVLGIMEFFSRDPAEPDEALLAMMGAVGSQIGQFIERKRAAQEAEEALKFLQARWIGPLMRFAAKRHRDRMGQ
ncbi:MAG: GAF domain-containing protein [Gammaproteobacteria bacterium]